ncbi:MAG: hypothetical protein R2822_16800 [Spirosomataceae bacterium]
MDKQKRHNHPTTDQLRQYVAGGLSHEEQHQVEKAALQNPQIDDTLEGLIALKETGIDTEATLVELRQRLLGRVEKKDKRLFPFYYASAAAVVLAVGLSWWLVKEQAESPAAVATSSVNKETTEPIEEAAPLSAAVPIPQKKVLKHLK